MLKTEAFQGTAHGINLTSDRIDEIVTGLCEMERVERLAFALRVGEFVVRHIYDGNLAALRSRGHKDNSFRALTRHPRLPFRATSLWRYVGIYELAQRLPGIVTSQHFGVSHARALLGLPHGVQEHLVRACIHERWTAAELETRAAARREAGASRPPGEGNSSARVTTARLRRVDRFAERFLDPTSLAEVRTEDIGDPKSARKTAERLLDFGHALLSRLASAN